MRNYSKYIFCLFSITVVTITAYGQVLPRIQNSLNNYNANALQEKLFVHTDKDAYTTAELVWFKIYNVDGMYHKPIDLSKVAYVEILDRNKNIILQAKIALKDGTGSGSLYIPITVSSGNFILRAYTSWMKNFSPDFYFSKKLTIINPLKSPTPASKALADNYDIQFFPEGGNLVAGISSVVGFKATNQWGNGVNFSGAVLNDKNDTIVKFSPLKFGMGHFSFKPNANTNYRAIINIGGKSLQKSLPAINNNGYVMNLTDSGNGQLQVNVYSNSESGNVYLFAHTRGVIKLAQGATMNNGAANFTIDAAKLGDGISHLTIFNANKQPVCERLYFKRPANNLAIDAATDEQVYHTRKKVNIDISAKDENNTPVEADLSLSVYRLDSLQGVTHQDIRNYLWLSSDLRGNIESPDYYFKNTDKEADEAIDNLMLTQGWSRFNWNDVLSNKTPAFKFLPELNGPIVNANIVFAANNEPAKEVVAYLSIPGKRVQMYAARSDSTGRLIFNMKNFFGPGEIVAETNTEIDTGYRIDVLNPFSEQFANVSLPALNITPSMQTEMQSHNLFTQVQNIYSGNKLKQFYDPQVDSSAYFGPPNSSYILDNYTRFTTVEEIMREYIHEVNITNSKGKFHIKVLNEIGMYEADPMVLIDGVPFFNTNKIFAADPLKLYRLDVVPFTYYWGPSVAGGLFSFISYKGDLGGNEIDPHAVVLDYDGLELQGEFYSPAYDTEDAYKSHIPDFRNVLYWAPNINTTTKGKNSISFYTSDQPGHYIGVIQGLTSNGTAGRRDFMFDVVK